MLWQPLSRMRLLFNTEQVTVTRQPALIDGAQIQVVGGLRVASAANPLPSFTADVVVHPMGGRDLAILPEGDRFKDGIWVFQRTPGQTLIAAADVLTRASGQSYQIQTCEQWGPYLRASAVLVDSQPIPVF